MPPRARSNKRVGAGGVLRVIRELARSARQLRLPRMPPITTSIKVNKVIRYQTIADFNYLPTIQDMLDQFAVIITSTTAKRLMNAFRIRSITIYLPPTNETTDDASIDGPQSYFSWSTGGSAASSSAGGDAQVHVLQSLGTGQLTRARFVPPKGSQASFWHDTTSGGAQTALFDMLLKTGAYVDFDVDYTMSTGNASFGSTTFNNVISTVSAATPGTFGIRGFPPSSGTQVLVPYAFNNV